MRQDQQHLLIWHDLYPSSSAADLQIHREKKEVMEMQYFLHPVRDILDAERVASYSTGPKFRRI
jgi:hypothetical protein